MEKAIRRHTISFQHAFDGLKWAVSSQPNFRVHLALSACALFLSWYLHISLPELTVIVFTIILGLTAELINTALEAMTDLITTQWRKEAKIAKDVAAGMMLTVAAGAVTIALIIFGPKLIAISGL